MRKDVSVRELPTGEQMRIVKHRYMPVALFGNEVRQRVQMPFGARPRRADPSERRQHHGKGQGKRRVGRAAL